MPEIALASAAELDATDPLAPFRERFAMDDRELVYLDGNSLGRLPLVTESRLREVVRGGWGGRLVRGWDEWLAMPDRVGDMLGVELLGARRGEVIVSDSTTVNLYKLAEAALVARPGRRDVVASKDEFPTDRYVVEGLARGHGGRVRWLDPDPVAGPRVEEVSAVLDEDVALVLLGHVNYRSAAIADVAAITEAAHGAGALAMWDLCHSAGAVPVELEAWGVDLAVGCTYKYLHGGPGSPAYLYVRDDLQGTLRTPIPGWFGQRDQFAMGPSWDPEPGIRGWLAGTPGILALACVEEGARLVLEAGPEAIRAKSVALTAFAVGLFDRWLAPAGCSLGTTRDPARRGSHVAVRHPGARALCADLLERGVVTDFRAPDSIRFGLAPLSTSFEDVERGVLALHELIAR